MIITKKVQEGDSVELIEDLPAFGLKRGQRGVVIETFDEPREAYDIEFEDEKGNFLGFAYSVKPEQINHHTSPELNTAAKEEAVEGSGKTDS